MKDRPSSARSQEVMERGFDFEILIKPPSFVRHVCLIWKAIADSLGTLNVDRRWETLARCSKLVSNVGRKRTFTTRRDCTLTPDPGVISNCIVWVTEMYLRFVVGLEGEDARWLDGVITEAKTLRDEGRLD